MTAEILHQNLSAASLSLPAYLILRNISESPETMTALAKILGYTVQSASWNVEKMESRGLVTRKHGAKDRRCVSVSITKAGEELLGRVEG